VVLLIAFAFVAGAGTAVSPCVLPVLPIVLSAGATGGRRRPLGIVTGLAASFTFATVALVYLIDALGLPGGLPRTLAIAVLIGFGIALMLPPLSDRLEARLSSLTARLGPRRRGADGFGGGLLVGASLGFVYAPCAGPILAAVITVSAAQSFTAGRLAVALAYGAGSAVVLYALALGGRRLASRLARRSGALQVAMGGVMVLVALAMLANLDTRFESAIASDLPSFLVNPTERLENASSVRDQLADVRGGIGGSSGAVASEAGAREADAGRPLPVLGRAPDPGFSDTEQWFNTSGGRPLSLRELRGHVVLVDFWTYSCINCLRTLPYLNAWYRKYHAKGLDIIGVHTPEFPFEHSASNVAAAIAREGIRYPVVQDNDYATWTAYHNEYWPAEYLIDGRGRVRLVEFGEGDYAAKERAIRSLLAERGAGRLGAETRVRAQAPSQGLRTPETYLGASRAEGFTDGPIPVGRRDFGNPPPPPPNGLAYHGTWTIGGESATAGRDAAIALHFEARRVFIVLGSPDEARSVRVLLDGKPIPPGAAGADVRSALLRVRVQRLYSVVDLPRVEGRTVTLRFQPGVTGYSFTFG
jgi:cytochrome c biogenesis protein CcdA/thiol-disulfide isomerase/thioredoxin